MSYFKLGEEVIIQGKIFKKFNGMDATVTEVLENRQDTLYKTNLDTSVTKYWFQESLRKKHKPSTESLSTMIEELNKVKV